MAKRGSKKWKENIRLGHIKFHSLVSRHTKWVKICNIKLKPSLKKRWASLVARREQSKKLKKAYSSSDLCERTGQYGKLYWRKQKNRKIASQNKLKYWKSHKSKSHRDNLIKSVTGIKNNEWKGGISKNYTSVFRKRLRKIVFERDGNMCQMCYKEKRGTSKFEVHHINGDKFNDKLNNLILLCSKCHIKIHNLTDKEEIRFYVK